MRVALFLVRDAPRARDLDVKYVRAQNRCGYVMVCERTHVALAPTRYLSTDTMIQSVSKMSRQRHNFVSEGI